MKTLAVTATPTHRQGSPTWARDHASTRVASATLVAATGDAAFAFVAYVLIAGRYNFETLLQYIATGILGRDAFRSGWTGVGTAAAGFAIHLALAAGFAAAFGLLAGPLLHTRTTTAMVGLAYGAGIWIAMAGVVLPALGVAHEPVGGGYWWAFLVDHALLIGLPIALLTRARRPRPTTRRSPTHPPCGTPSAATPRP